MPFAELAPEATRVEGSRQGGAVDNQDVEPQVRASLVAVEESVRLSVVVPARNE
jgi:hypothetical protein